MLINVLFGIAGKFIPPSSPRSFIVPDIISSSSFHRSWVPSTSQLITVARDGICKIWNVSESNNVVDVSNVNSWQPFNGVPVTAIAIWDQLIPFQGEEGYLTVVGSEEGKLSIWWLQKNVYQNIQPIFEIPLPFCHGKTVKRLVWRQSYSPNNEQKIFEFASCSEDNSVRIHRFSLSF
jgi:WD40 repeat protein